ncbi:MAG: translation initiation inhibitor [Verrucomicrobiales bacterium]|nr:translation initiation inhibitor [Verrucomicrobiales bacterium]
MRALLLTFLIAHVGANAESAQRFATSSGISFYQLPGDDVFSSATKVEDRVLAHSAQFFPFAADESKRKVTTSKEQTRDVLEQLNLALRSAGTTLRRCVKMNVYLASASDREDVSGEIINALSDARPAVCFVEGTLALSHAKVAIDAVAAAPGITYKPRQLRSRESLPKPFPGAHASLLPMGSVVYVSGQAVKGESISDATRKTMKQLGDTLKFLKLDWNDVVQIKSFLDPVSESDKAAEVIASFFDKDAIPPQVFVEWTYKGRIEIEIIVDAGPGKPKSARIDYITPDGMPASPVYCKVTRINNGAVVYVSGMVGQIGGGYEKETASAFEKLEQVLKWAGSDMRHLVKATYYVSDSAASRQLNKHRPTVYDPARPPAASKAPVRGVGSIPHTLNMDMIATTVP